tara:strand:- start:2606 stop:2911 length:306 start_codon:yes stop_codon:yes gene_type:complete
MNIDERTNTITITVDLQNMASVRRAIELLRSEANFPPPKEIVTNKVRLIKLVRAFGDEVAMSSAIVNNGDPNAYVTHNKRSLKHAKLFVESAIEDKDIIAI